MPQIYRRAAFTDVWLGYGDPDIEAVFDLIKTTFHCFDPDISELRYVEHQHAVIADFPWDHYGKAIAQVAALPYWRRLWILQEIALSREVYLRYGSCILPIEQWYDLLQHGSRRGLGRYILRSFGMMRSALSLRLDSGGEQKRSLVGFLEATAFSQCEDTRDRIYGLLGLLDPALVNGEKFKVDYSEPIIGLLFRTLEFTTRLAHNNWILDSDRTYNFWRLIDHLRRTLGISWDAIRFGIAIRYHIKVPPEALERHSVGIIIHLTSDPELRPLHQAILAKTIRSKREARL